MKLILFMVLALGATHGFDLDTEWEAFKIKYGKTLLAAQEHDARKNIFANNLRFIEKHNAEHALGLHTYTVGINKFADLTNEEFVEQYTGYVQPMESGSEETTATDVIGDTLTFPTSIDWREKGAVTPVKDQGHCGSCWAFSGTGTMEGAYFRKTGRLVSLSEQNLIDCDTRDFGCYGGNPYTAIYFTIKNGGLDTEASYPYEAKKGACRFNETNIGATMSYAKDVAKGNEGALTYAIGTIGPISVAIDSSHYSFQLYKSGIYNEPKCSSDRLDHGVLAVGYGTENGQDYYIVKNSWGTGWGNEGYIKMSRNRNNQCGIAKMASYAIA